MPNERVEDYVKNPNYEERIVAFCDVLGWRSQIAKAGSDADKIGGLRRQILLVGRMIGHVKPKMDLRFSSFSDNIVLSGPANELTFDAMTILLNDYQLSSAVLGFLTRGGMTIGEIYHDSQVVFGPALNRAYELESTVARYPRLVLDINTFRGKKNSANFLVDADDDCLFLNPFTVKSIGLFENFGAHEDEFWDEVGLPKFRDEPFSPLEAMKNVLNGIKPILRSPLTDKDYERVSWLYDRVARELGVPLSGSYPRIRP